VEIIPSFVPIAISLVAWSSPAEYQLNAKIDSHTQRLLQCSLRFYGVFHRLVHKRNPAMQGEPTRWRGAFSRAVASKRREFAR
jgi:hypothetical protein